ncbi:5-hydroxytryptamine receptor 1A-beta-like [Antedon mediterranea]|uniref:5-hydroxytryptamine receptor 1A-beta-like n=1 Tax=Antedon mediterranea TaxID=105859 RepID=UPI003AF49406
MASDIHTNWTNCINQTNFVFESSTTVAFKLIVAFLLVIVISCIFCGNILVLLAIWKESSLQLPQNYLIASLALSDLLLSILVLPISLVSALTDDWVLGNTVCNIWISSDVFCCTASILNLCIISLDRYWAITQHVNYMRKRTRKRMITMIIFVWLVALVISITPLLGLRSTESNLKECIITQNKFYTIFSTFGAFFIPMTVMLVVYWRTFRKAMDHIHKQSKFHPISARNSDSSFKKPNSAIKSMLCIGSTKQSLIIRRERRATKTLCIVTGAFLISWLPFFITALILPFCSSCSLPQVWGSVFLWLGYSNSAVNPIIYTKFNKDFQHAFRKLLHLKQPTMDTV